MAIPWPSGGPGERAWRLFASIGWIALVVPLSVVLLSVLLSPQTNWTVRAALAAFCTLAILRPDAALLVTAGLGGFGIILAHLGGVPALRVTEVLIVASLAGCFVRAVPCGSPFRSALTHSMSVPVVLFAIAAVASTVVWQRVYQFQTMYPSEYLAALLRFIGRDYFIQPGDFWVLVPSAIILEGLALYVAVAALCRMDATFFERTLRMLALGGAGLAVMSVVRLAEILLRNPGAIETLRATSAGLRISPQIPDYIAAGSYFGLCWLAAVGLALVPSRSRPLWLAAGMPLLAALYLTGSRSVIAAALAGALLLAVILVGQRAAAIRGIVTFAIVAIVAMVSSYSWLTGRDVAGEMARQSLTVRTELVRTGLRVIETRPLFGVGIDRFYLVAGAHASPELRRLWQARLNPHNDFIRFGAEMGLVGLGLFLWILAAAGRRTWQALQKSRDVRLAGLAGGLVAFLVTSLVSNPLMVREVSYVFWIGLGLAAGQSVRLCATGHRQDAPLPAGASAVMPRLRLAAAVLLGGVLVLSVPFRARQELAAADLTRVTYGLFDWGVDTDGTRSRWSGPRARLFVDGRARLLEIPLAGAPRLQGQQQVEVRVDGRLANRVSVGPEWLRVRIPLPGETSRNPRRIDLTVSPSWMPSEVIPGNEDHRVLGVRVGELRVISGPNPGG